MIIRLQKLLIFKLQCKYIDKYTVRTATIDMKFLPVVGLSHYNDNVLYLQSAAHVIRCSVDEVQP